MAGCLGIDDRQRIRRRGWRLLMLGAGASLLMVYGMPWLAGFGFNLIVALSFVPPIALGLGLTLVVRSFRRSRRRPEPVLSGPSTVVVPRLDPLAHLSPEEWVREMIRLQGRDADDELRVDA
jgi:hypothetical protein